MKTLILTGSARKKGYTHQMVERLCAGLQGEYEVIDTYRMNVSPCLDCRRCFQQPFCVIQDDMQEIYRKIDAADCIVLASPMYFHSVSGKMKVLLDRLQVYWAGHGPRKDAPSAPTKVGGILLVGGAPDFPQQFTAGILVLQGVLGDLCARNLGYVTMGNSDRVPMEQRLDVLEEIDALAKRLNEGVRELGR